MSLKSGATLRAVGTTLVKTLAMPVPTKAYRVPPAQALSQGVMANSSRHQQLPKLSRPKTKKPAIRRAFNATELLLTR